MSSPTPLPLTSLDVSRVGLSMFVDGTSPFCIGGDDSTVAIGLDLAAKGVGVGCGAGEPPSIHLKMATAPLATSATSNTIRSNGNFVAFKPPVSRGTTTG